MGSRRTKAEFKPVLLPGTAKMCGYCWRRGKRWQHSPRGKRLF